jgi:hypothetical protein
VHFLPVSAEVLERGFVMRNVGLIEKRQVFLGKGYTGNKDVPLFCSPFPFL